MMASYQRNAQSITQSPWHCDFGYCGDGSTCTQCPATKSTTIRGATTSSQCTVCDFGYYGDGTTCTRCPHMTTTNSTGKTAVTDCLPYARHKQRSQSQPYSQSWSWWSYADNGRYTDSSWWRRGALGGRASDAASAAGVVAVVADFAIVEADASEVGCDLPRRALRAESAGVLRTVVQVRADGAPLPAAVGNSK
eukprot:423245-Hanusia_phi.AAC.2